MAKYQKIKIKKVDRDPHIVNSINKNVYTVAIIEAYDGMKSAALLTR